MDTTEFKLAEIEFGRVVFRGGKTLPEAAGKVDQTALPLLYASRVTNTGLIFLTL
jgi:hypothetical protein